MSGEDVGGYGGPSDDGVGMAMWRLSLRLDNAREEFVRGVRGADASPVVKALLARSGMATGGHGVV